MSRVTSLVQMPVPNNGPKRVPNQQDGCWVKLFLMIVQLSSAFRFVDGLFGERSRSESMTFYGHSHLRLKRYAFSIKTWKYTAFLYENETGLFKSPSPKGSKSFRVLFKTLNSKIDSSLGNLFYKYVPLLLNVTSLYMLPVKYPVVPSMRYLSQVLPELG